MALAGCSADKKSASRRSAPASRSAGRSERSGPPTAPRSGCGGLTKGSRQYSKPIRHGCETEAGATSGGRACPPRGNLHSTLGGERVKFRLDVRPIPIEPGGQLWLVDPIQVSDCPLQLAERLLSRFSVLIGF